MPSTIPTASLRWSLLALGVLSLLGCPLAESINLGDNSTPKKDNGVGTVTTIESPKALPVKIRVATFNIKELSLENLTLVDESGRGASEQTLAAAEVIQTIRPDVLLINEIDHDYTTTGSSPETLASTLALFNNNYLNQGAQAINYVHFYAAPCNTGMLSGMDLDNDGTISTEAELRTRPHGNDSFGYGEYPGQYSMGILSKYPLDLENTRTFQKFLWKDLPGNHLPTEWYSEEEQAAFRLSSKSHWDVPVLLPNGARLHLFASHPTPPVFDGEEDRNGRRNFDEVRFWAEYINNNPALYDDAGQKGGFTGKAPFVILGDLNADEKSDPIYTGEVAIQTLLKHPRVVDHHQFTQSVGGLQGREAGSPNFWERATADFLNGARVDYVLASDNLKVNGGGVHWPDPVTEPAANFVALKASDHRLVWLDVELPAAK